MNPLFKLIFALTIASVEQCLGQDTVRYCQTNSPWVSNCFHFYKTDNNARSGTVEKIMSSDDGQRWYGLGRFTETKNKISVQPMKLVRSRYHFQGDSFVKDSLTNDATFIPTLTFHKQKGQIVLKGSKRRSTIYSIYRP